MLRKKHKKDHSPALFLPRKNDFLHTGRHNKPLTIAREQITRPAHEVTITGGSATYGPYFVKRKPASKEKLYYISNHNVADEYFALEILQYIGINTPKLRVTSGSFHDSAYESGIHRKFNGGVAAVKSIDGYTPMFHLLVGLHCDVYLDVQQQKVIMKNDPSVSFKISGQVFAAFIASCLIDDSDFGFEDINFGMFRVGNRYYSAAIDKDCAQFSDSVIRTVRYRTLKIFKSVCLDQELFIISKLQQGLRNHADGKCDFDLIFQYSRVNATPEIAVNRLQKSAIFKDRAQNIINLYLKSDPDCMVKFAKREAIRHMITDSVLATFNLENNQDRDAIRDLILEDLRGPYYSEYFFQDDISKRDAKNERLITAIRQDISEEFSELTRSVRMTSQR